MQKIFDYSDDYSTEYRSLFTDAITESRKLGFTREILISEKEPIFDDALQTVSHLLGSFSEYLDQICPGYWGNYCQTLSSNIFACLNANGINANIVLGNVIINGTDEFEASLENMRKEYFSVEAFTGDQSVHAWVSLGDDTIIDAAMPSRLVKRYAAPTHINDQIFIGRASEFSVRYHLRYQPIIVGSEFFAKTNPPDPMHLLNLWKRQ